MSLIALFTKCVPSRQCVVFIIKRVRMKDEELESAENIVEGEKLCSTILSAVSFEDRGRRRLSMVHG